MNGEGWPREARWDGHDLAAVQRATALLPRVHGRPAAEVDEDWNLTVCGVPVQIGMWVIVTRGGSVELTA